MAGRECYKEINELLNRQLEEKKTLIAVHRGSWGGNLIENTVLTYEASLAMGADMFECDLSNSTDGVLYAIHDGGEMRLFGYPTNVKKLSSKEIDAMIFRNCIGEPSMRHVERFEEVLQHFTGTGALFNIDRAWWFLDQVHEVMQKYPEAAKQAVIKTPVKDEYLEFFKNCPVKYMYMPIAYNMEEIKKVLAIPEINMVGVELIAPNPEHELYQDENLAWLHEQGLYLWANTITLSGLEVHKLYGGMDDDTALSQGPDASWGVLMDKGLDILQTDWPVQLNAYRAKRAQR